MTTAIALSAAELAELASCETVIEHGLKVFQAVGVALITIREKRLYRAEFATFETYCAARWGFTDERARLLMRGAEVAGNIAATPTIVGVLPANEAQVRPLITLTPEQQRAAWQQAVETAPNGKVTGAHVEQVAQQYKPTTSHRSGVRFDGAGAEPDLDENGLPLTGRRDADEDDEDIIGVGDTVQYLGQTYTVRASGSKVWLDVPSRHPLRSEGLDPEDVILIERAPARSVAPRLPVLTPPETKLTAPIPVVDDMPINESHPVGYAALYATDDAIGYGKATCSACGQTHNGWTPIPAGRWKCRCGETTNDDQLEVSGREEYELEQRLKTQRAAANSKSFTPLPQHLSGSNEWYTPEKYVEAARAVMGAIDLDPASCEQANRTVKAQRYYSEADNGLKQEWFGRVFVNPPYGMNEDSESNQAVWSARLIAEWEAGNIVEGILLVNAATAQKWFAPLWKYPICFTDHRIRFVSPDGDKDQPPHGSVFVYFGHDVQKFARVFSQFGAVVMQVWRDEPAA